MERAKDDPRAPKLTLEQSIRLAALQNRQVTNSVELERAALEHVLRCWCVDRAIDYVRMYEGTEPAKCSDVARDILNFVSAKD